MQNNAKRLFVLFVIVGLGILLWQEREKLVPADAAQSSTPVIQPNDEYTILQKIKPGGYIGWHQTEKDKLTSSPKQTRQSSAYYFVCRDQYGRERIFQVDRTIYNAERVGNVLTGRTAARLTEVPQIEEPPLPSEFEFRRRDPTHPR